MSRSFTRGERGSTLPRVFWILPIATILFFLPLYLLFPTISLNHQILDLDSLPRGSETAPGIGFDLTPAYGTAAVRYHNGTIVGIGKISADDAYKKMIERMSLNRAGRLCYPYRNNSPSSLYRSLRKLLGLPASQDVRTLAKFLTRLRHITESHLNYLITSAVISSPSSPYVPGLCPEDIVDALAYIGITALTDRRLVYQPHHLSAAYAGYGFGLCENYKEVALCNGQEAKLPHYQVLGVLFTNDTMMVALVPITTAVYFYEPINSYVVDNEAGLAALANYPGWEDAYWDRVMVRLIELTLEDWGKPHIDKVMVYGESVNDEKFLEVLEDAMHRLQGDDLPKIYRDDALFVAARGAAEFAKRALEDRAKWNIGDKFQDL